MYKKTQQSIILTVSLWIISCLVPTMSSAVVVVQTEIVSGNITQKFDDHSVKLDNGTVYYPSRMGLMVDLPIGEPVTLRIVEETDRAVFLEYAAGTNSLQDLSPMLPKKDNSPK